MIIDKVVSLGVVLCSNICIVRLNQRGISWRVRGMYRLMQSMFKNGRWSPKKDGKSNPIRLIRKGRR